MEAALRVALRVVRTVGLLLIVLSWFCMEYHRLTLFLTAIGFFLMWISEAVTNLVLCHYFRRLEAELPPVVRKVAADMARRPELADSDVPVPPLMFGGGR